MTNIKYCSCDHKYQDAKYGQGKRLHNEAKPKNGTGKAWTCTVCGNRKEGGV